MATRSTASRAAAAPRAREPLRPFRDDILLFLADFSLPPQMSSVPRVFLIDGSSQMYRAYHAMRGGGLSGPRRQDHARGLHLRDDAAKADSGPSAAVHRRVVRSARPTFRDDLVSDYKANRAPMPSDLAEQIPLGARGLRGARRADHHVRALRGRRRDRHAGDEGACRRASRSRSSPATRTSSSSWTTASRSTTRATKARGSTPRA